MGKTHKESNMKILEEFAWCKAVGIPYKVPKL